MLLLVIMAGCKSQSPKETADDPGERLTRWYTYYGIDADDMKETGQFQNPQLPPVPFFLAESCPYNDLLVFTPDSGFALDLDSYHLVLEKRADGQLHAMGREADMEIAVISIKGNTRQRVLFCGTPCLFEEGEILPDGRIVITGFSEYENTYRPTRWVISSDHSLVTMAMVERAVSPDKITYISDVRLSHIHFRFAPTPPSHLSSPLL